MSVAIVNYGMGNLASVSRAVETIGHTPFIASYPEDLRSASHIILPGVGAFAEGMERLGRGGWTAEIRRLVNDEHRPLLGICLGMQFLAEQGDEGGDCKGLGLVPGEIRHLSRIGCDDRIPHVGWNEVHIRSEDPLLADIPDTTDFYFVHSYAFAAPQEHVLATVTYGCDVAAIVRKDRVWGTQFHPEKSSKAGLHLLRNFLERG